MKILLENEPSGIQTELKDMTDGQLLSVRDAAEAHLEARGVNREKQLIALLHKEAEKMDEQGLLQIRLGNAGLAYNRMNMARCIRKCINHLKW